MQLVQEIILSMESWTFWLHFQICIRYNSMFLWLLSNVTCLVLFHFFFYQIFLSLTHTHRDTHNLALQIVNGWCSHVFWHCYNLLDEESVLHWVEGYGNIIFFYFSSAGWNIVEGGSPVCKCLLCYHSDRERSYTCTAL